MDALFHVSLIEYPTMNTTHTTLAALIAAALLVPASALAADVNANLNVKLSIVEDCLFTLSESTLDFGGKINLDDNTETTADIQVTCGAPFKLGFGNGANAQNTQRRMRQGTSTNYVNYQIYKELAHTTVLGNDWATPNVITGTGTPSAPQQTITIYGLVPNQATPALGDYTDTVVMTLQY